MWNMEYLFRVLLMLFSSLVSRGSEIRMVNIVDRIKASCIKIVRLVLETESGGGGGGYALSKALMKHSSF